MKKTSFRLCLFFIAFYANLTLAFNTSELEKTLNNQIPTNPEEVFFKIEELLKDNELSLVLKAKLMVMQSDIAYFIDQPEYILKYSKLALASGLLTEPWDTRVLISQSRGYFQRGQFKEFFASANMAVLKAERSNLSNYRVSALVERAFASNLLGNNNKANKDLNLAIKYLDLLPNNFDKAIILERFSAVNTQLGHIETAKKYQHQANDIYKKIKSIHFLSISYYNLGRIYQEVEDWEQASQLMLQSYHWALEGKNKLNQAFSLSRLSEFQNNLGKYELAKKYLNDAIIAADASTSERVKIHVRKSMANILCKNNELQECKTLLLETISFAKSYNMQLDQVELMHILAQTYYLLGSFEQAYLTLKAANNVESQ